jgi:hypothetical protein
VLRVPKAVTAMYLALHGVYCADLGHTARRRQQLRPSRALHALLERSATQQVQLTYRCAPRVSREHRTRCWERQNANSAHLEPTPSLQGCRRAGLVELGRIGRSRAQRRGHFAVPAPLELTLSMDPPCAPAAPLENIPKKATQNVLSVKKARTPRMANACSARASPTAWRRAPPHCPIARVFV